MDSKAKAIILTSLDQITLAQVRDGGSSQVMMARIREIWEPKAADVLTSALQDCFMESWSGTDNCQPYFLHNIRDSVQVAIQPDFLHNILRSDKIQVAIHELISSHRHSQIQSTVAIQAPYVQSMEHSRFSPSLQSEPWFPPGTFEMVSSKLQSSRYFLHESFEIHVLTECNPCPMLLARTFEIQSNVAIQPYFLHRHSRFSPMLQIQPYVPPSTFEIQS